MRNVEKHLNIIKVADRFDQVEALLGSYATDYENGKFSTSEFEELKDALDTQQHRICDKVYQGSNWFTHNAELELVNTRELHEFIKPYFQNRDNCLDNLTTFLRDFFKGYHGPRPGNRRELRELLSEELIYGRGAIDYKELAETLTDYFRE